MKPTEQLNDVVQRFKDSAAGWAPAIRDAADRLFVLLMAISFSWTFGMMALRKADIGEFFAELIRFMLFFGFFYCPS